MSKYEPISCASYERLELSIMHGAALLLGWQDATGLDRLEVVRPGDLETSRGEEFLIAPGARKDRSSGCAWIASRNCVNWFAKSSPRVASQDG